MKFTLKLSIGLLLLVSCQSSGQLTILADMDNSLKEVSAVEFDSKLNVLWVIEDAGNSNNLIGLNTSGNIVYNIDINNAKNKDWEDLTQDKTGNIYIGDFGNNNEKRDKFKILKVSSSKLKQQTATAEFIEFSLPKGEKSVDIEAFFIYDNSFYLFSKEDKKFSVFKVPNTIGKQKAKLLTKYEFKGEDNKITSAAIDSKKKIVVLLNRDKLWRLNNFEGDDFFSGDVTPLPFYHNSQKEGIGFKDFNTVYITDERNGNEGGNIYSFKLN